ncbi:MAG TPA: metal-dependent hydrolase [Terriglobales bacterium]|nr:metal-dependent hydrolase [Terriglobales bacterium]
MLVGHFGVSLAAKRFAPKVSLGTLMLASLFPDLLAWALLLAGIEHARIHPGITRTNSLEMYDTAISHSLATAALWGALLAAAYFLWRRHSRASWVILCLVLSHWLLDFLSHRPDMPLAPGVHHYFGLGLYNSPIGILVVEGFIWLGGIVVYARATRARKRAGAWLFWGVVVLLTALWLGTLSGSTPPDLRRAGISSLLFFSIVVLWAYLVDLLRSVRQQPAALASSQSAGQ